MVALLLRYQRDAGGEPERVLEVTEAQPAPKHPGAVALPGGIDVPLEQRRPLLVEGRGALLARLAVARGKFRVCHFRVCHDSPPRTSLPSFGPLVPHSASGLDRLGYPLQNKRQLVLERATLKQGRACKFSPGLLRSGSISFRAVGDTQRPWPGEDKTKPIRRLLQRVNARQGSLKEDGHGG